MKSHQLPTALAALATCASLIGCGSAQTQTTAPATATATTPGAAATAKAPCTNCQKAECSGCAGHDHAAADDNAGFKMMTAEQLNEKLQAATKLAVIDVNSEARYAKGHVPGATHLLRENISATTLPADKAGTLVFYCGSPKCMASHKAAKAAIGLGYTDVWVMSDGIAGWESKGLKTAM